MSAKPPLVMVTPDVADGVATFRPRLADNLRGASRGIHIAPALLRVFGDDIKERLERAMQKPATPRPVNVLSFRRKAP